jgi:thiol-disulfide isomerase/thioredoxin
LPDKTDEMRNAFLWITALTAFAACKQKKDGGTATPGNTGTPGAINISLTIRGADTGRVVFMYDTGLPDQQRDTVQLKNGQCSHTIKVDGVRNVYTGFGDDGTYFYMQPGTATMSGHVDSMFLGYMNLEGDAFTSEAKEYYANATQFIRDRFADFVNIRQLRNSGKENDMQALVQISREMNMAKLRTDSSFAAKYPKHEIMAALILEKFAIQGGAIAELDQYYLQLGDGPKAGFYGKKIADFLDKSSKTNAGHTAMDFVLNDVQGEPLSLAAYKGKYVLVDFWASWCRPCRAENPVVVEVYNRYKNRNFDIVGVSLDENYEQWVQAIQQDGLAWRHASDLKGWNSDIARMYDIQSIPANFLLNPQGRIIARDLRGADLARELEWVLNK